MLVAFINIKKLVVSVTYISVKLHLVKCTNLSLFQVISLTWKYTSYWIQTFIQMGHTFPWVPGFSNRPKNVEHALEIPPIFLMIGESFPWSGAKYWCVELQTGDWRFKKLHGNVQFKVTAWSCSIQSIPLPFHSIKLLPSQTNFTKYLKNSSKHNLSHTNWNYTIL